MSEWLLGALLVLAVVWLIVRIRQNKAAESQEKRPKFPQSGRFHAVAIQYSVNACDAAKAMTGRRFLANAAPELPLEGCDYPQCRCKFAHYDDRRSKHDRRSPFSPAGVPGNSGGYDKERRKLKDRRNNGDNDNEF